MIFYSTRDRERRHPYSLSEAAFKGLAPDGGLFVPETVPEISMDEISISRDRADFLFIASLPLFFILYIGFAPETISKR